MLCVPVCGSVHVCAGTQTRFPFVRYLVCWDGHVHVSSVSSSMYQLRFFSTWATFSVAAAGLSSSSQLRRTQGARANTRRSFGHGRACSGRSKSLDLASNHGIVFRPAERSKAMETPIPGTRGIHFCWLCYSMCYMSHTSPQNAYIWTQPRCNSSRSSSLSFCDSHEQQCFCVCGCVRVCHRTYSRTVQAVGTSGPGTTAAETRLGTVQ